MRKNYSKIVCIKLYIFLTEDQVQMFCSETAHFVTYSQTRLRVCVVARRFVWKVSVHYTRNVYVFMVTLSVIQAIWLRIVGWFEYNEKGMMCKEMIFDKFYPSALDPRADLDDSENSYLFLLARKAGIEPRFLVLPARNLVTIPTTIFRK